MPGGRDAPKCQELNRYFNNYTNKVPPTRKSFWLNFKNIFLTFIVFLLDHWKIVRRHYQDIQILNNYKKVKYLNFNNCKYELLDVDHCLRESIGCSDIFDLIWLVPLTCESSELSPKNEWHLEQPKNKQNWLILGFKWLNNNNKQWYHCREWQMKVYFLRIVCPCFLNTFLSSPIMYVFMTQELFWLVVCSSTRIYYVIFLTT